MQLWYKKSGADDGTLVDRVHKLLAELGLPKEAPGDDY